VLLNRFLSLLRLGRRDFTGRLRNRLIGVVILPISLLIAVFGLLISSIVEEGFQTEFAKRLISVADFAASRLEPELLELVSEGEEQEVLSIRLRDRLDKIRRRHEIERLYVFSREDRCVVDTSPGQRIGDVYLKHQLYESEMAELKKGLPVSTTLYTGAGERLYMTGFTVIPEEEGVRFFVAAEGAAGFFGLLERIRRNIYQLVLLGFIVAAVASSLFIGQILKPLSSLVRAIRRIADGRFDHPVDIRAPHEIGQLLATFNEMQEAIRQRDERLQLMLRGIAHEVRNPLGGIELFSGLLAEELVEQPAALDNIRKIQKETKNLKQLVDEFLNYARTIKLVLERINFRDFIAELEPYFQRDIERTGVTLEVHDDGSEFQADLEHLRRAFFNLIENALAAIEKPEGFLRLIHRAMRGEDGSRVHELLVEDSGVGIAPEVHDQIFEPFFTTKERGSGLGLALVRKIVREHGGSVVAESLPEQGTRFRIVLPDIKDEVLPENDVA